MRVTGDRIVNTPFPKDGVVTSPLNTPGKIEAAATGATVESGSGGSIGAQIVTFVATNQNLGVTTVSAADGITTATTQAEISLICNP